MNCYHLKDWIINDPVKKVDKQIVEDYITNNRELSICADICNGLKHLQLDRERSGESPKFGKKEAELNIGTGPITIALKYEITTKTGTIDAFELATKCMKAWEDFIKSIP